MDLHALRYFVHVADAGSIHGGARRALVAQPAVSVAVKKLEREVGSALFVRSPRGVRLTGPGRALLAHARDLLRRVDELEREARGLAGGPASFTVGLVAGRAAAGELTGLILAAFQAARPWVDLRVRELDFSAQFDAVLDGVVDVALVRSPVLHDDLVFRPLFSEPSVLVASPAHRLARRSEVTLAEVLAERPLEVVRAPREFRDFWGLAEYRSGSTGTIPTDATTLIDYSLEVLKNATVSPMAQSGWRCGALGEPTIRVVTILDAPRSVAGVGHRADDERDDVRAFVDLARATTADQVGVVPDAAVEAATGG